MSTNAGSWFYKEPESQAYLISERLNATFWESRIVSMYWRCIQAEAPFRAEGYSENGMFGLEWVPGQWLAFKSPKGFDAVPLVEAISKRILAFPASITYQDHNGLQIVEWHRDGGKDRWDVIQGHPQFVLPRRL